MPSRSNLLVLGLDVPAEPGTGIPRTRAPPCPDGTPGTTSNGTPAAGDGQRLGDDGVDGERVARACASTDCLMSVFDVAPMLDTSPVSTEADPGLRHQLDSVRASARARRPPC